MAVYPEVTSLCTEKEAGHPPPGSQPGSLQWAEAGGERVYGGGGPKANAAPLASSWQVPVPGDCRCSEGWGSAPAAGCAARAGSPLCHGAAALWNSLCRSC